MNVIVFVVLFWHLHIYTFTRHRVKHLLYVYINDSYFLVLPTISCIFFIFFREPAITSGFFFITIALKKQKSIKECLFQVIHPGQVSVVQAAFSPPPHKVEWAAALVEAFQHHQQEGKVRVVSMVTVTHNLSYQSCSFGIEGSLNVCIKMM